MLSLSMARPLKETGLTWSPSTYDFFAVPDRGLDDHVFVISPMSVMTATWRGRRVVTFQGTLEWALDYVLLSEVVWLPTEEQLRSELERRLLSESQPSVQLQTTSDGYTCMIQFSGEAYTFNAFGASEAYAAALLHVLQNR